MAYLVHNCIDLFCSLLHKTTNKKCKQNQCPASHVKIASKCHGHTGTGCETLAGGKSSHRIACHPATQQLMCPQNSVQITFT